MTDNNQQDFLQEMQQIMHDFKEGGRLRDKEGRRIARRTAQIVRWSSVGMVLLGAAFLTLLLILTKDLVLITSNIVSMSEYTHSMSKDLHTMVGTVGGIRKDMVEMKKTMSQLGTETHFMRKSMVKMDASISTLPLMNGNVEIMSQNFLSLNHQLATMTQLMKTISIDTNHMSKPMRMMPWK